MKAKPCKHPAEYVELHEGVPCFCHKCNMPIHVRTKDKITGVVFPHDIVSRMTEDEIRNIRIISRP